MGCCGRPLLHIIITVYLFSIWPFTTKFKMWQRFFPKEKDLVSNPVISYIYSLLNCTWIREKYKIETAKQGPIWKHKVTHGTWNLDHCARGTWLPLGTYTTEAENCRILKMPLGALWGGEKAHRRRGRITVPTAGLQFNKTRLDHGIKYVIFCM